ncbi:MAG: hypothetical protein H7Z12_05465 [Rhodospirillaceae bacterium]|nr:hypothetical protein [Rhodospirillales bacterium]
MTESLVEPARGLSYPQAMSSEPASDKKTHAPKGIPPEADRLNCVYDPIRLDDLLCGLEPLPDGDDGLPPLRVSSLEPALLLTEIARPSPVGDGGWAAEVPPPARRPAPVEAPPPMVTPVAALREADPSALMEALTILADTPEPVIEPAPEPEPEPEPVPVEQGEIAGLEAMIEALIAAYHPLGMAATKGDSTLPKSLDSLALLLSDPPPAQDFAALDALYACWPKTTVNSDSRALLAVAHNLSRNFGLPGKLPMASSKAWCMLSPMVFETELAQRLIDVGTFIADWQKTQRTFLILEFGEVELIEHLFEALNPAAHADLLAGVMNFKVLSNRRMGLLRRIPYRLKRQVTPLLPHSKEEALVIMAHTKALLEQLADPSGFAPIVQTANKLLEELEKMMKAVAAAGAPPPAAPPGGGLALGRMG